MIALDLITATNKPRQSLPEAIRDLIEYESGVENELFPVSQLRVEADRIMTGEREYRLEEEGFRRLCSRFHAPADYLTRLHPDLRARVLESHFREGYLASSKLTDATSNILSRNGAFLNLCRADLLALDSSAVLQGVQDGVGEEAVYLEVQDCRIRDEGFCIDIVSPRMADEVRVGDVIEGGIRVEHSFVSEFATTMQSYVVRLKCKNGLVQRECSSGKRGPRSKPRTRRLPRDRVDARAAQQEQIRRLAAEIWGQLREKLDAINRLKDEPFEIKKLERFLRQARLYSNRLMKLLEEAWTNQEGNDPTAFGVLNALTWIATHSDQITFRQRTQLARLAGIFAGRAIHFCPHCFSDISNP